MSLRKIHLVIGAEPYGQAVTWSYPNFDGKLYTIPTYLLTANGMTATGAPARRQFEVLRFGVNRKTATATPRMVGRLGPETFTIQRWLPNYKVHSFRSQEDGAWQVTGNYLIHDGPDHPLTEYYATAGCIEICGWPHGFVQFNDWLINFSGAQQYGRGEKLAAIGSAGVVSIMYRKANLPPVVVR